MESYRETPVRWNELQRYEVDPHRGFLPSEDPLEQLPARFAVWEDLVPRIPSLIMTGRLRAELEQLPAVDLERLETGPELERAMLLMCVFGNAYVWSGEPPAATLPRSIALPWDALATRLGRPPIISHASIVLRNWRRIDPDGPLELNNMASLVLFGGGIDESWFYLIPAAIEARGAPALRALIDAQHAVASGDVNNIGPHLDTVMRLVDEWRTILARTPERCDPYIFYHRVRPYLTGWPEPGLVYQGVDTIPRVYAGGSAAQSSLLQAVDAGLGITHDDESTRPFLEEMRRYMPPAHRNFLEALRRGPSIRQCVLAHRQSHPTLSERFDACISALDRFRKDHMAMAVHYITHQAADPDSAKGTGGTPFARFLGTARKETRATRISPPGPTDT